MRFAQWLAGDSLALARQLIHPHKAAPTDSFLAHTVVALPSAIPLPLILLSTRIPSMSLIRPTSLKQLNCTVARRTLATVADPAPSPRVRPAFGTVRHDWRRSEIQNIFDGPLMETIYRAVSHVHSRSINCLGCGARGLHCPAGLFGRLCRCR